MNRSLNALGIIFFLIVLVVASGAVYTVNETQQAVITQFGEPMGGAVTTAGLYFKIPFIQRANYFEKRLLEWDGDQNQIPTGDKRYIWVDTAARWRISDPLKFMQSVGNEASAQSRLDDIIDAATRDTISGSNLIEAVRSSNDMLERVKDPGQSAEEWEQLSDATEKVYQGRDALSKKILQQTAQVTHRYGIELVDVLIKRVNYVQDVRNKVYERMVSERKRAAEKFRSEGLGKKAEIEGQMKKELEQIRSEAYRQAQEIQGTADAEAIRIYADAYNNDPEFYSFTKTLETYQKAIGADSTLIITTDSDFYRYMKSIGGSSKADF